MSATKSLRIPFKAPLQPGDTADVTVGCRANNPDICKNNGIPECVLLKERMECARFRQKRGKSSLLNLPKKEAVYDS